MANGSFQEVKIEVYSSGILLMDNLNSCYKDTKIPVSSHSLCLTIVISVALGPMNAGKLFATGSGDCRARIWSYELKQ
jgi:WD40 repeat protein